MEGGDNLTSQIEQSVAIREMQDVEPFVFTDHMVFERVFYKGTSKTPFLFELVIRLHQVQMRGDLILHVVHITVTIIIEAGIYGILRGTIWEEL